MSSLGSTATVIAWAVVTVISVSSWFTWFSVELIVIPCFVALVLDALATSGRLQDRREPVQASPAALRWLRIALVTMVATALCGMYASTAPSRLYHGESQQISGIIAPALWILIIVFAVRALSTSSPRRVANLSLVAAASWPIFVVLGALSEGSMLDAPMTEDYEIPRWALAVFTIASAAVVGATVVLARLCIARSQLPSLARATLGSSQRSSNSRSEQ